MGGGVPRAAGDSGADDFLAVDAGSVEIALTLSKAPPPLSTLCMFDPMELQRRGHLIPEVAALSPADGGRPGPGDHTGSAVAPDSPPPAPEFPAGGWGILLTAGGAEGELPTVDRVVRGGPADRSGLIQPGDRILRVNGESVRGSGPAEMAARMIGRDTLRLTVLRVPRIFDF
jgi:hypothetical protein